MLEIVCTLWTERIKKKNLERKLVEQRKRENEISQNGPLNAKLTVLNMELTVLSIRSII